jgi:hypothetical protein
MIINSLPKMPYQGIPAGWGLNPAGRLNYLPAAYRAGKSTINHWEKPHDL